MQIVKVYEGTIPKNGASVFEFKGIKFTHRSLKKDKIDVVVHIDTGIIISTYPPKTDRNIILDDLAKNIDKIDNFINNPEGYQMVEIAKGTKKDVKEAPEHVITMQTYSNGEKVKPRQACNVKPIRKFDMRDAKWK